MGHGTVVTLPRSGHPTKSTPAVRQHLIQEVTATSECLTCLGQSQSSLTQQLKRLSEMATISRPEPLTKKNRKTSLTFCPKKHLMIPHDFRENVLLTDGEKRNFLKGVSHFTSDIKKTQYNYITFTFWPICVSLHQSTGTC